MSNKRLILLLFIMQSFACKKDPAPPVDVGYDYFPTDVGTWVIYDVDSIVYDDFNNSIYTYEYQIYERIESTFTDGEGRETQRIERYKRDSTNGAWIIKDVWFANRTNTTAEKVEENVRFIKLTFPARSGNTWDGNASNTIEEWEYRITEYDVAKSINGVYFDSCLTVLQKDYPTAISKEYYLEIYAKHVGLIYKKSINLEISSGNVLDSLDKGFDYTIQVNSYGK